MCEGRIVVLGLGNVLMTDEGIGVHVVRRLAQESLPPTVEALDGGTAPLQALTDVADVWRLIIVDALGAEGEAGAVYRLAPGDIEASRRRLSLHESDVAEALTMWRHWGLPMDRISILGVVPDLVGWGTELSPALRGKLDAIVKAVLDEVEAALREQPQSRQERQVP